MNWLINMFETPEYSLNKFEEREINKARVGKNNLNKKVSN